MDYSERGKLGAKGFWKRFYDDESLRNKMKNAWKHPQKDRIKAHNAAVIAAEARWRGHTKRVCVTPEKGIPPDTKENLVLKARLCAFLSGDGSLFIRKEKHRPKAIHYDVRFYPDNERVLELFLSDFKILYNKEPKVIKEDRYSRVCIKCKRACLDLTRFTKFKSLEWKIPNFINTNKLKREWLRAFFDCEAYVGQRNITVQSVNRHGLIEIQRALTEFSIESKLYSYERKQKNWNTNYILVILKKPSRENFLKYIGFNHSEKQAKLEKLLPTCQNPVNGAVSNPMG